jgi:hypothetical protein
MAVKRRWQSAKAATVKLPNALMSHVAAVSWAATQTPEITLGNHSATKAGFLSANQMEVFCFGSLAIRNRKHDLYPTRFNELISWQLSTLTPLFSTTETAETYRGGFDFSNSSCAVIE